MKRILFIKEEDVKPKLLIGRTNIPLMMPDKIVYPIQAPIIQHIKRVSEERFTPIATKALIVNPVRLPPRMIKPSDEVLRQMEERSRKKRF